MAGLKWNTGNLYYSTVELGYQHLFFYQVLRFFPTYLCTFVLGMLLISLLHTVLDGGPRTRRHEIPDNFRLKFGQKLN